MLGYCFLLPWSTWMEKDLADVDAEILEDDLRALDLKSD